MSLGQEVFLDELHQIFLSLASEVRPTGGPLPGDLSSPPVFEVVPIGVVLFLGHCVAPGGASRCGSGRTSGRLVEKIQRQNQWKCSGTRVCVTF